MNQVKIKTSTRWKHKSMAPRELFSSLRELSARRMETCVMRARNHNADCNLSC